MYYQSIVIAKVNKDVMAKVLYYKSKQSIVMAQVNTDILPKYWNTNVNQRCYYQSIVLQK